MGKYEEIGKMLDGSNMVVEEQVKELLEMKERELLEYQGTLLWMEVSMRMASRWIEETEDARRKIRCINSKLADKNMTEVMEGVCKELIHEYAEKVRNGLNYMDTQGNRMIVTYGHALDHKKKLHSRIQELKGMLEESQENPNQQPTP